MTFDQKLQYYEYSPDSNNYAGVQFSTEDDIQRIHWIDKPLLKKWYRPQCLGFDDNPSQIGDFPSVTNFRRIPMLSRRAWDTISSLVEKNCEVLPVDHPFEGEYFLIHMLITIDALDMEKSTVERYSSGDKRISKIVKYCLKPDLIRGCHMFKLPIECGGKLLMDEVIKNAIESNSLIGLRFDPISLV